MTPRIFNSFGKSRRRKGADAHMIMKKAALRPVYGKILVMAAVLIGAFFFSMCIGRYSLTPVEVARIIGAALTDSLEGMDKIRVNVVLQARLPRILLSMLIGAGLASSGAAYQCIFGNPLVSPDILGVSAGAGFGAAAAILFSSGVVLVQSLALAFGLLAVALVLLISRMQNKRELFMLVLSGVIVSANEICCRSPEQAACDHCMAHGKSGVRFLSEGLDGSGSAGSLYDYYAGTALENESAVPG